jgi:hypothetical protein
MRYTTFPGSIMPAQVYATACKLNQEGVVFIHNLKVILNGIVIYLAAFTPMTSPKIPRKS